MLWLRQEQAGRFVDNVVEANFQLLVLAESAECLGHGIVGVKDGQDVAGASAKVPSQFLKPADRYAKGGRCAAHGVPARLPALSPLTGQLKSRGLALPPLRQGARFGLYRPRPR